MQQINFGKPYLDKTWCTFGNVCKHSEGCEKVLTQEIVDKGGNSKECHIRTFVQPPIDCFELDEALYNERGTEI